MRLLLLEDDTTLGEGLSAFLRTEGHVVDWFTRLADVVALRDEPYDTLLVDWQLPDGSGLEWIRKLRASGMGTPIVMLTARDLLCDRIRGLDGGADDYMVKPFEPEELSARVRAVCRRQSGNAGQRMHFGDVEVDLAGRSTFRHGGRVDLSSREWTVLESLIIRAGRIVSKSDLEALMLGFDGEISSNAIEVYVSGIRRKLGFSVIETVRGMGYRVPR